MKRAARFILSGLMAGVLGAQVHPASPCGDFFAYATAGRNAPAELEERNAALLREILEDAGASLAPEGTVPRQLGDFFASGMDAAAIARAGLGPLREGLARIDAVRDVPGLGRELARLRMEGVDAGFALEAGPQGALEIAPGGLGLPGAGAYLAPGDAGRSLRAAYLDYLARLFLLSGETQALSRAHAGMAFDLERRLAAALETEGTSPATGGPRALAPRFPWAAYFEAAGLGEGRDLQVRRPRFLEELSAMAADTPAPQWRVYLKARLLDASAPFLTAPFEAAAFDFRGRVLAGQREPAPRWRRVLAAADAALGDALGQMFAARACSPRTRARALDLAERVRAALGERLKAGDPARSRLGALAVRSGYPDTWCDYAGLRVDRAGYLGNARRAAVWASRRRLAGAGGWETSVHEARVSYDPRRNELVIPAGVLRPPFFDAHGDDAANAGALGSAIGRELARAFGDRPADVYGLELALAALPRVQADTGPTPEQRFFLGFARSRGARAEVNGPLAALPAFAGAFCPGGLTPGQGGSGHLLRAAPPG